MLRSSLHFTSIFRGSSKLWHRSTPFINFTTVCDFEMTEEINTITPNNRREWREWLEENYDKEEKVWVVMSKKSSKKQTILYPEVVEESLCFGWIDSRAKTIDDEKWMQLITRRKDKSVWSAVNKKRISSLIERGLMTDAGLDKMKRAKQNGSWESLDAVEALTIPGDLQEALNTNVTAQKHFEAFSSSSKKAILLWIQTAKRTETRSKRIEETVKLAEQNIKSVGQKKA